MSSAIGRIVGAVVICTSALFGVIGLDGCKEKDVPYIIDSAEIENYMKQSEDAVNLFRANGLVKSGSYTLALGGPTYYDTVLSSSRSYDIGAAETPTDMGSYGLVRVGTAKVVDQFTIRTTRKLGNDSTVTQQTRSIEREGVFWKLGDDGEPYAGWLLWGFKGGRPSGSAITFSTVSGVHRLDTLYRFGDTTKDGERYIRIREGMPSVVPGGQFGVAVSPAARLYPLISSVNDAGYFIAPIPPADSGRFATTVTLPAVYDRLFDVALIQFVNDSLGTVSANPVFIPYKILR